MYKIFFTACIMLCALATQAQRQNISTANYKQIAGEETKYMDTSLVLNAMQHDSVYVYKLAYYNDIAAMNTLALSAAQRADKTAGIKKIYESKLQRILTIAQWKQYLVKLEATKKEMPQTSGQNH